MRAPVEDAIALIRHRGLPHVFDVELRHVDRFKAFDSVECHLVLYPYSRSIGSKQYVFTPFEEYVNDVNTAQRSAYARIPDIGNRVFGLFLAALLALFCTAMDHAALTQAEALVSVLGAYFLGKDFWCEIENLLVSGTASWRLSFRSGYYAYRLERNATLINYSTFAKKHRYGREHLLPEMIDFIAQSNSETLRMFFPGAALRGISGDAAHLCSIRFDPDCVAGLDADGFLFGVKLSCNRDGAIFTSRTEVFQSLSRGELGCLNAGGEWCGGGGSFRREVLSLGRLRLIRNSRVEAGERVILAATGGGDRDRASGESDDDGNN